MNFILKRWARLAFWKVFLEANVLLLVGLVGFNQMLAASRGGETSLGDLVGQVRADPFQIIGRSILFPPLETLIWQAAFVEGFDRLGIARLVPVLLSAGLFALTLHWHRGISAVVGAFWFWLVLGCVYSSQKDRSFLRAFALTTFVHWTLVFLLVALLFYQGMDK